MNIVFVSAESSPFVKVGGLADVVGTLPAYLKQQGHGVRVILPHHGVINDTKHTIEKHTSFQMPWHGGMAEVHVSKAVHENVEFYFVRSWPYFNPQETFVYSADEGIDVGRFVFFNLAVLEWVKRLAAEEGWTPDVFHVHDWHTALLPFFLRRLYYSDPVLSPAGVLFTIHNMKYQGWGIGWHLEQAGLPHVDHHFLHALGKADNALAVGLAYSTMLNTVSPNYAEEILRAPDGYGLEDLLSARRSNLAGVINGIDTEAVNPSTNPNIEHPYAANHLDRRLANKAALQSRLDLPLREDVPIIGTVIRLVDQKGPDILLPAMWRLLVNADVQFVLLGTGFYHYEQEAWKLGDAFRKKAKITLAFDSQLADMIYAGSDMFLMPSLFEPCGIGQMLAMRYGSIPIVRAVGGLADTVSPDVGFLFKDYHPGALEWAVSRALDVYFNKPEEWAARQKRAMEKNFDWSSSAQRYVDLYQRTMDVHQSYHS